MKENLKIIVNWLDCGDGMLIKMITRVNERLQMDWLITPILRYPYYSIYPPRKVLSRNLKNWSDNYG